MKRSLKDAISQLSDTFGKDVVSIVVCTVDSVDPDSKTCNCTPISGNATTSIPNVLLASEPNDGILITPAVDSTVIVGLSQKNIPFVMMYEDIESFLIQISQTSFKIEDGLTQFNDGSFGGLTKTQELKTQIEKTNEVVNIILTILTGSPINEPGNGAPSALQAALSGALASKQVGDFSDIENTLITHGE